jgi:ketosteroid isomerase-like protein
MCRVALWICVAAVAAATEALSPSLKQIVDTERAFARASVRHGQRDAFLAYLADDAITFSPGPGRGPEGIRKRPTPPPSTVLNWAPLRGAASHSGDLGFTTGPYVVSDSTGEKPPRSGVYLTVWRRHPGGRYLVDLDVGVTTSQQGPPLDRIAFTPLAGIGHRSPEEPRSQRPRLRAADDRYNDTAKAQDWAGAAARFQRPDARLHVDAAGPLVSRAEIDAWMGQQGAISFTTSGQRSSNDGDLGYTYGSFQQVTDKGRGWYVRVWTREPRAQWRVLIEQLVPLPPR